MIERKFIAPILMNFGKKVTLPIFLEENVLIRKFPVEERKEFFHLEILRRRKNRTTWLPTAETRQLLPPGIHQRSLIRLITNGDACIEIRGETVSEIYDKMIIASNSIKILKRGEAGFFIGKFFGKKGEFSWTGAVIASEINPVYGGKYTLYKNDLEELKTIYKLLCEKKNDPKVSMIIERFLLSISGGFKRHIRVIEFFSILESLYLPQEGPGELGFRLSQRIARLLFLRKQRYEKYKEIKTLYDKRGTLIHQLEDEFSENEINLLEDLTRKSIKLFLKNQESFTRESLERIFF